jgi:hypothetical protein
VPRVTPKPKVAGFCAALWLDFTPALTVKEVFVRPQWDERVTKGHHGLQV